MLNGSMTISTCCFISGERRISPLTSGKLTFLELSTSWEWTFLELSTFCEWTFLALSTSGKLTFLA
jgi:hypothetical protein